MPAARPLENATDHVSAQRFGFGFEWRYRGPARLFGVTPRFAHIDVSASEVQVRFGPWRTATPLDNISDVQTTGPYSYVKTAGPARLAVSDFGLTFATNSRAGVLLRFARPIAGIDWMGAIRHPELTVTPEDVTGLAALLTERISS